MLWSVLFTLTFFFELIYRVDALLYLTGIMGIVYSIRINSLSHTITETNQTKRDS